MDRILSSTSRGAKFKEFEPRLNYDWFQLKSYLLFQDVSRRSIETGFDGFKTQLKFVKFGYSFLK